MNKERVSKELTAEIEKEIYQIDRLKEELDQIKARQEIYFKRAKGSILHDFYNACERIFRHILQEVNGILPEDYAWHKNLLYKMTLDIKGIRPRVISEELAAELDEYLGFRHLFRNIYGFELQGNKIDNLIKNFARVHRKFKKEVRIFLKKIKI